MVEDINLDEQFQVTVVIDKQPPFWKDFKNVLWRMGNEFSLKTLITDPCIEKEAGKLD